MSRIETISPELKVLVKTGPQRMSLAAQQVPMPESPHQAAIAMPPAVEEDVAVAPVAKAKPKRKRRARRADGTFKEDNLSTPDKDEAWVG